LEGEGDLMMFVERRLEAMCATLVDRAAEGNAVYQRLIDDGHLTLYQGEVAFVQRYGSDWM
jgi:hypothetical protein